MALQVQGLPVLLVDEGGNPLLPTSGIASGSAGAAPGLWQLRTLEVEVTGITTQTTAYTAADAVGTGQSVDFGAPPNLAIVITDVITSFDVVPTTTQVGVGVNLHSAAVTAVTDNGKVDVTGAEQRSLVAVFTPTTNTYGGIPTDTGGGVTSAVPNTPGHPIPTAADGTLWMICACTSAFTIPSSGKLYVKFIYRYANFAGFA